MKKFENIVVQICNECKLELEISEFRSKECKEKIYYEHICKKCSYKKGKLRVAKLKCDNIEKYNEIKAKQSHRDKKYYAENKEQIKARNTNYYTSNKTIIRAQRKEYYKLHPEKLKEQRTKFLSKIENKIASNLRRRTRTFLHSGKEWSDLLGCNIEHFISWLEFNFEKEETDMTLENYGKVWQLDHVYPLSKFDMKNNEDVKKAFNWQNILPAICIDNQVKNNKVFEENMTLLENRLEEFKVLNSS